MLTTAEALDAVLAATPAFSTETVDAGDATGRVLRQIIRAERSQPPFDRVMMDGITFAWSDYESGQRSFPLQAMQAAGDPALTLESGQCIEIMTGASLPANANCIVPVERIIVVDNVAEIEADYEVKKDRFVHPQGSDFAQGAHLLTPGKRISPLDIAIIASCGEIQVDVAADPVVRVISTGNELVAAGEPVEAHQIRLSNGPAVLSLLERHGYRRTEHDHIVDDVDALRDRLRTHLEDAAVLPLGERRGDLLVVGARLVGDVARELQTDGVVGVALVERGALVARDHVVRGHHHPRQVDAGRVVADGTEGADGRHRLGSPSVGAATATVPVRRPQ